MVYSQDVQETYPMLELTPVRKNKVNLADYNCQQDIENRMLLADSSPFDLEVFEEILFSPLKISIKKLARNMGCREDALTVLLEKLSRTGLLVIQGDAILIDKEMRKYFEFQIARFDPAFKPDMEFLQGLLRKVPIHFLPIWYSIPRTSNNIFESIVEKYLLTPQIFQRYLSDLHFADPVINSIVSDLFSAPDFKLYSSDVIGKYNLARRDFEEILLLLEFNFIGCLSYQKEGDHWIEVISPFHEWHQYLRFLKTTESPILKSASVQRVRKSDFAFIEDMSALLALSLKKPIPIESWDEESPLPLKTVSDLALHCSLPIDSRQRLQNAQAYLTQVLRKLILVQLARSADRKIYPLDSARDWLDKPLENRALHLYRHVMNRILTISLPSQITTERNIREAEKSIRRLLHGGWVLFDDFLKGVYVSLSEESVVMLKRMGKQYKYALPAYGENEKKLLKATIFELLFETGVVATGVSQGQDCFSVTPFGRFCFED